MKPRIVGIVAEYNPFHKGHEYQLNQALAKSKADASVIVLSSSFTQRGEPALIDKWERTETALLSGADLVLELPVVFSSHNAGPFANASVDILRKSGIVTHISFGMESPSPFLSTISGILIQEPEPFKLSLKSMLKKGYSFVEARAQALNELLPGAGDFSSLSNNNLAISYCCRLIETGSEIIPVPVKRLGRTFHETDTGSGFASATGIRNLLARNKIHNALGLVPDYSAENLRKNIEKGRICKDREKLWPLVRIILERMEPETSIQYAEMGEGLLNRLKNLSLESGSLEELVDKCTSKRHTRGRIQRGIIHTLLAVDHWDNRAFQRCGPQYIRVLGYREKGRNLLRRMRHSSELPVITRSSAQFNPVARKMMDIEHRSSRIWESLVENTQVDMEKNSRPVFI